MVNLPLDASALTVSVRSADPAVVGVSRLTLSPGRFSPVIRCRPQTRKRSYQPPADLPERLREIVLEVVPEAAVDAWQGVALTNNDTKYRVRFGVFFVDVSVAFFI